MGACCGRRGDRDELYASISIQIRLMHKLKNPHYLKL